VLRVCGPFANALSVQAAIARFPSGRQLAFLQIASPLTAVRSRSIVCASVAQHLQHRFVGETRELSISCEETTTTHALESDFERLRDAVDVLIARQHKRT
jgi:hypothetical protein